MPAMMPAMCASRGTNSRSLMLAVAHMAEHLELPADWHVWLGPGRSAVVVPPDGWRLLI
jgi:hypothetical protein